MSGNVCEWCRTKWRDSYWKNADEDINGENDRVVRGGSYFNLGRLVRCSNLQQEQSG